MKSPEQTTAERTMPLRDVTRDGVESAIREFDRICLDGMLRKYSGGKSTEWYIERRGKKYDQKLVLRTAHELQGLGSLPPGRGTFKANEAQRHLRKLGYRVVPSSGHADGRNAGKKPDR